MDDKEEEELNMITESDDLGSISGGEAENDKRELTVVFESKSHNTSSKKNQHSSASVIY
jgi:hypothetical protein